MLWKRKKGIRGGLLLALKWNLYGFVALDVFIGGRTSNGRFLCTGRKLMQNFLQTMEPVWCAYAHAVCPVFKSVFLITLSVLFHTSSSSSPTPCVKHINKKLFCQTSAAAAPLFSYHQVFLDSHWFSWGEMATPPESSVTSTPPSLFQHLMKEGQLHRLIFVLECQNLLCFHADCTII